MSRANDLDRLDEIGCALGLDHHKRRKLISIVIDTSSPGGTFCTLCEHVLPELGEDTVGLDKAAQRILKQLRARHSRLSP